MQYGDQMRFARVVTVVEQCLERFEQACLIPFWERVAHCFSYTYEVLTYAFRL
jgi:hypothetical protein